MEALEVGKADWALQLVQEMLGYQLEHLLMCTCGCAIPIIQAIIIALQLRVAIVHVFLNVDLIFDFFSSFWKADL